MLFLQFTTKRSNLMSKKINEQPPEYVATPAPSESVPDGIVKMICSGGHADGKVFFAPENTPRMEVATVEEAGDVIEFYINSGEKDADGKMIFTLEGA